MAVIRSNILTSPHTAAFVAGVLELAGRSSSITPKQLNGGPIVQQAPGARILGTAARAGTAAELVGSVHVVACRRDDLADARRRQPGAWRARSSRPGTASTCAASSRRSRRHTTRLRAAVLGLGRGRPAPPAAQLAAPIWSHVGPPLGQITTGPFGQLRVRLVTDPGDDRIYVVPARPISRDAGQHRSRRRCPTSRTRPARSPTAPSTGRAGTSAPTASATSSKAGRTRSPPAGPPACTTACTCSSAARCRRRRPPTTRSSS